MVSDAADRTHKFENQYEHYKKTVFTRRQKVKTGRFTKRNTERLMERETDSKTETDTT